MDISEFLRRESVVTDLRAANKDALLRELSSRAAAALLLDAGMIATALIARENLGSTGMGGGIAFPHARLPSIAEPFGMLARLRRPIEFGSVDGMPVDIFFLLLLPLSSEGGGHLNALACAARRLRFHGLAETIRRTSNAASIFDLVTSTDECST